MRATVPHFLRIAFLSLRRFLGSFCGSGSVNLIAPPRCLPLIVTHGSFGSLVSRADSSVRISLWRWAMNSLASRGLLSFS